MKTTSIRVPTSRSSAAEQPGCPLPTSRPTSGPASSSPATVTGTSTTTDHVSSADAVLSADRSSPRATEPASSGTARLASAPPATTSNRMLGIVFAVK